MRMKHDFSGIKLCADISKNWPFFLFVKVVSHFIKKMWEFSLMVSLEFYHRQTECLKSKICCTFDSNKYKGKYCRKRGIVVLGGVCNFKHYRGRLPWKVDIWVKDGGKESNHVNIWVQMQQTANAGSLRPSRAWCFWVLSSHVHLYHIFSVSSYYNRWVVIATANPSHLHIQSSSLCLILDYDPAAMLSLFCIMDTDTENLYGFALMTIYTWCNDSLQLLLHFSVLHSETEKILFILSVFSHSFFSFSFFFPPTPVSFCPQKRI